MTDGESPATAERVRFAGAVDAAIRGGARFAGLFAVPRGGGTRIVAVLATRDALATVETLVARHGTGYPAISPVVASAAWYEREIADLFGIEPDGHHLPRPLVLPLPPGSPRPRPGAHARCPRLEPDPAAAPAYVGGDGMFTLPYGPVRSGVFEAVEYLLETPGEDLPHVEARVFYKHRGVERRFEDMAPEDGVLLAERVEGVASVAHAIAYCEAIERIAGTDPPVAGQLVRVLHAELERIANHLDSTVRHTDAAGQAVAFARLTLHKERVLRLRARICGSRFGRGVVVPGGVLEGPRLAPREILSALDELESPIRDDIGRLMSTPSFLDRLRSTGVLTPDLATAHGALGPVGRGSGSVEDVRLSRPYGAYAHLSVGRPRQRLEGDALARQLVRNEEIEGSFHLLRQAADELDQRPGAGSGSTSWHVPAQISSGEAFGWAEAPQGEVLYLVVAENGRLARVKQRSASFHNLALFSQAFPKDIFTDFAFIEASFGISIAGVAG